MPLKLFNQWKYRDCGSKIKNSMYLGIVAPIQYNLYLLHEKNKFLEKKLNKTFFQNILVSHLGNVVYNVKTHVFANFGHDIINLAMDIAMTTVIWLESHGSSYMVVHCVKTSFPICGITSL